VVRREELREARREEEEEEDEDVAWSLVFHNREKNYALFRWIRCLDIYLVMTSVSDPKRLLPDLTFQVISDLGQNQTFERTLKKFKKI